MNRTLDTNLLAVMMSTHARLGAERDLKNLDDHLVTPIFDLLCRESKTSCLLGKAGVFACPCNHHLEVLLQMKRRCLKRFAMCVSRPCLSGCKCFLAGRVTAMVAPTVMLRRTAEGPVEKEEADVRTQ